MSKHIFITGGVVSSLGKGITSAALAQLLKMRGLRVAMQKLDPYLNVDPGTMSPYQHGEVFVTDDGAETDLDLGHYERIADVSCSKASNYTSGRIYSEVIARERAGGYLGGTVQVIPHITDEIKRAMRALDSDDVDIVLTEIGGTIGDIESLPFLEAARQFRLEEKPGGTVFIHLTLVPFIKTAGEIKTKPSQQSVATLRSIGIQPDILVCRAEKAMGAEHMKKLSMFCNIPERYVIEELDVTGTIYEVPLELAGNGLDERVLEILGIETPPAKLDGYASWVESLLRPAGEVTVAVAGKYVKLPDAYKSIYEALRHAGYKHGVKVNIEPVDAEALERDAAESILGKADAILVPGGFGGRGIEGKINAVRHARENNVPFLGICLGMQCAVIEFARNVVGWKDAASTEFSPETTHPVIDLMEEQRSIKGMGGTMRLGAYPCNLKEGSRAMRLYGEKAISERHRHRYEFAAKTEAAETMEKAGLSIAGTSPDGLLAEIVELKDHPYFVAVQFHPEFKSRPLRGHPLFAGLVEAALARRKNP